MDMTRDYSIYENAVWEYSQPIDDDIEIKRVAVKLDIGPHRGVVVPAIPSNSHYREILLRVEEGTLTIAEPDA
jgi:hypothetical protein